MEKPKLFVPNQEDYDRVGKIIASNLSKEKSVVAGNKKFRGKNKTHDRN